MPPAPGGAGCAGACKTCPPRGAPVLIGVRGEAPGALATGLEPGAARAPALVGFSWAWPGQI